MDFLFIFAPIKLLILNSTVMFTDKFTISFRADTMLMKELQLDSNKLEAFFTAEEINIIKDLSFFEETVDFPIIENGVPSEEKTMRLDSFASGIYDFIKGGLKIVAMPEPVFKAVLHQYPQLISKENITKRNEIGKKILFKYCPEAENRLF